MIFVWVKGNKTISPTQDSNYYGCGSTDDTLQQTRYFTCPVGNGLFLPLASVAKEQEWLMPQRKNNFHAKTEEHVTTQPRRGLNINTNHLPFGTKVIVRPKDGRQIRGTIRWVGKLPLPLMLSTEEIPVYGVETVSYFELYIGIIFFFFMDKNINTLLAPSGGLNTTNVDMHAHETIFQCCIHREVSKNLMSGR